MVGIHPPLTPTYPNSYYIKSFETTYLLCSINYELFTKYNINKTKL